MLTSCLFLLPVPNARTEIGKRAFVYSAAPLHGKYSDLKHDEFILINAFKFKMKDYRQSP